MGGNRLTVSKHEQAIKAEFIERFTFIGSIARHGADKGKMLIRC